MEAGLVGFPCQQIDDTPTRLNAATRSARCGATRCIPPIAPALRQIRPPQREFCDPAQLPCAVHHRTAPALGPQRGQDPCDPGGNQRQARAAGVGALSRVATRPTRAGARPASPMPSCAGCMARSMRPSDGTARCCCSICSTRCGWRSCCGSRRSMCSTPTTSTCASRRGRRWIRW